MCRWSLLVVLLAGLGLGCAAREVALPAPPAADPFAGCEWAHPRDNMFQCGRLFVAFMPQSTPPASFEVLLDSALAGFQSGFGEEVHRTPAPLGSLPEGSSLLHLESKGRSLEGMAFMGPPGDPSSDFFALCIGKADADPKARCGAMFVAAIAGHMPKRSVPPAVPPDAEVGPHRIKTFPGCRHTLEAEDLQQVICGSTYSDLFTWVPMFKLDAGNSADFLWDPVTRHYSELKGIEVLRTQAASCQFHGMDARSCRFLAMLDTQLGKTYEGAMLLVEFGTDAYVLQCFSTRPEQPNLCSLNEVSIRPIPAP